MYIDFAMPLSLVLMLIAFLYCCYKSENYREHWRRVFQWKEFSAEGIWRFPKETLILLLAFTLPILIANWLDKS